MLNLAIKTFDHALIQIDRDVVFAALRLSNAIKLNFALDIPAFSSASLTQLKSLNASKKNELIERLHDSAQLLVSIEPQKSDQKILNEVLYAKSALQKLSLKVSDRFWQTLATDEVVEIYGLDMCQIYRSFSFFKFSGYSILDILVFEWFNLWQRPKLILSALMNEVKKVISGQLELMPSQVPHHILREVLNTNSTIGFEPRACEMRFHNYGIVTDADSNEIKGFICSASGNVVARGLETYKIGTV